MALPKRKTSKSRKRKRRSHQGLPDVNFAFCPKCKQPKLPHTICEKCGYYNEKVSVEVKEK